MRVLFPVLKYSLSSNMRWKVHINTFGCLVHPDYTEIVGGVRWAVFRRDNIQKDDTGFTKKDTWLI